MDAVEAKVRCMELAHRIDPHDHSAEGVVKIATVLYDWVNSADKPKQPEVQLPKPRVK